MRRRVALSNCMKRVRTSKKDLQASHAAEKLVGEAMITIEKLMQRERGIAILLLLLFLLSLVLLEENEAQVGRTRL